MSSSIIRSRSLDDVHVALMSAPYEHTASSRKGTIHGPARIVECLDSKLEFYDRRYKRNVCDDVHIAALPPLSIQEMTPEDALRTVKTASGEVLSAGVWPVLLGGEHSVSLGLLQALADHHDPHDVTLIQIDAHMDMRDTDADYSDTPSRLAHSCVMRRVHELGYRIVQIGIRTYAQQEYEYAHAHPETIKVFEWSSASVPTITDILTSIQTQKIYITVDVDGFDPAYMPGTGTPVQGGLEWWYGVSLIEHAIATHELVGADIVEVSPMSESVLTEYGAAQLCYDMIAHKFLSRK